MKARVTLATIAMVTVCACQRTAQRSEPVAEKKFDPCEALRETNPHCGWKPHWVDSGVSVNELDGTRKQCLRLESTDVDGIDFGRFHFATLFLCFDNGKLRKGKIIGLGVTVDGILDGSDGTSVRFKFDDEKLVSQTWGRSEDYDTLYPRGREQQILAQLLSHQKLILEFSYWRKGPRTVTFELSGLAESMRLADLHASP